MLLSLILCVIVNYNMIETACLDDSPAQIREYDGILRCIGKTPLTRLKRLFPESPQKIYGKLELFNPGGSIKDRIAYNIVREAIEAGKITKDTCLIESTSGNMGIALARLCHYFGLKLILVTDPHLNKAAEKILRVFNAQIIKVEQHDGYGGYLNTRLAKVQELMQEIPNCFWPDQYHNFASPQAHIKTYQEILDELQEAPDYIFIPTSTCGTLRGFADAIATKGTSTKIIAVDAVGSVIFGDEPRLRLIPGMGANRPSFFLKKEQIFDVVHIADAESVIGCRDLLCRESILAGGSSGAVVKAIEKTIQSIPDHATIVALIPDSGERYLETIYSDEWVIEKFGEILNYQ